MTVKWSEIEAECGSYRGGFVAVFRKYEGQATDEEDSRGRTIKVTQSSFARHVGIPEQTFADWVRSTAAVPQRTRDRVAEGFARLPPERKAEFVREAIAADPGIVTPKVAQVIAANSEAMRRVDEAYDRHQAREPQARTRHSEAVERQTSQREPAEDLGVDYLESALRDLGRAREHWTAKQWSIALERSGLSAAQITLSMAEEAQEFLSEKVIPQGQRALNTRPQVVGSR